LAREFRLTNEELKALLPSGQYIIDNRVAFLIDGQQLAQFMMDFGVGVATDAIYELKRLDSDYFTDT